MSKIAPHEEKHILVVEDNEEFRGFLQSTLDSLGYGVTTAGDVASGLAALENTDIHLILSDMHLPDQTGMDLLTVIKSKWPHIPVIIITGLPQIDAAVQCIKIGAFDYVSKPVDIERLRDMIVAAFERAEVESHMAANRTIVTSSTRHLDGYSIRKTIGEGSMGIVFLADRLQDAADSPQVAIKIIKKSLSNSRNDDLLLRFVNEVDAISQIDHPNIIKIYDHGFADDVQLPYYVMELLTGEPLTEYCEGAMSMPFADKVNTIRQVASALAAAHQVGIWHRDVKPDNIFVAANQVIKLTDFGIAHLPDSDITDPRLSMGTPSYLSPEGFDSNRADHRTDLFSLGAVSYELFAGRRAFPGESISEVAYQIQVTAPPAPTAVVSDFPMSLQRIIGRMLQKDPDERYQTAHQIVADIEAFQASYRSMSNGDNTLFSDYADGDWS